MGQGSTTTLFESRRLGVPRWLWLAALTGSLVSVPKATFDATKWASSTMHWGVYGTNLAAAPRPFPLL